MTALSPLLETFFTERLISQRRASPHTVASYRDAWCLLLEYAQVHLDIQPAALRLEDLDAPFIGAFLDHLERVRKNSVRTRNARLAAVRSFFRFASLRVPEHGGLIARVLAIPEVATHPALATSPHLHLRHLHPSAPPAQMSHPHDVIHVWHW